MASARLFPVVLFVLLLKTVTSQRCNVCNSAIFGQKTAQGLAQQLLQRNVINKPAIAPNLNINSKILSDFKNQLQNQVYQQPNKNTQQMGPQSDIGNNQIPQRFNNVLQRSFSEQQKLNTRQGIMNELSQVNYPLQTQRNSNPVQNSNCLCSNQQQSYPQQANILQQQLQKNDNVEIKKQINSKLILEILNQQHRQQQLLQKKKNLELAINNQATAHPNLVTIDTTMENNIHHQLRNPTSDCLQPSRALDPKTTANMGLSALDYLSNPIIARSTSSVPFLNDLISSTNTIYGNPSSSQVPISPARDSCLMSNKLENSQSQHLNFNGSPQAISNICAHQENVCQCNQPTCSSLHRPNHLVLNPSDNFPGHISQITHQGSFVLQNSLPQFKTVSSLSNSIDQTKRDTTKSDIVRKLLPVLINMLKENTADCSCSNKKYEALSEKINAKEPEVVSGYSNTTHFGKGQDDDLDQHEDNGSIENDTIDDIDKNKRHNTTAETTEDHSSGLEQSEELLIDDEE